MFGCFLLGSQLLFYGLDKALHTAVFAVGAQNFPPRAQNTQNPCQQSQRAKGKTKYTN